MPRRPAVLVACLALSAVLVAPAAASHWSTSSEINNPVSTAHSFQQGSVAVSDGQGGVISAWMDLRNELYYYIRAQRINANGDAVWTTDGVLLSNAGFNQQYPEIVTDGAGGAIVVWDDQRADISDLYAQRIDANGNVLWNPGGVPIAVLPNLQALPKMVADGAGGAIITWTDMRVGTTTDIYAQRINANGAVQWTPNGVPIVTTAPGQQNSKLATDGDQGAIIAWEDYRNDPTFADIYAQRVLANGTRAWTTNGVPVAVQPFFQRELQVSYAVGHGAYVTWEDSRAGGTDFHIYFQHLYSTGAPAFTVNGLKVSQSATGDNFRPQIADATSSLAPAGTSEYIVWEHETAGGAKELILNEVSISGFVANEVKIDFGNGDKLNPHIATNEGEHGVFITWTSDVFYGPGSANVYVTKYLGGFKWSPAGYVACRADGSQGPVHVVSDLERGAILVWDDRRFGPSDSDVRAQRMDFVGQVGYGSADITSIVDHPQDQGLQVIVSWSKSFDDYFDFPNPKQYSVWRRYQNAPASMTVGSDSDGDDARLVEAIAAGVSPEVAAQQLATGWELAGTVPAMQLSSYALTCPTYGDYLDANSPQTGFMVVYESSYGNWFSAEDSAPSLDNLVPTAPSLVGSTLGADAQLNWVAPANSPDVTGYRVYRSNSPGVTANAGNLIATVSKLSHLDLTTGGQVHYYVVTAIDDATQEGPVSNEVAAPTGVLAADVSRPDVLSLAPARGNPARGHASFRYGLPADADVSFAVFDVRGRQVHDARVGRRAAGWHEFRLDGSGDMVGRLGAGTYFLRLQAGDESRVLKFALLR